MENAGLLTIIPEFSQANKKKRRYTFGVIEIGDLKSGDWQLEEWRRFWTFSGGLVFGIVRGKSGGIVAPMILHGLPQANYSAITGL